MTSRRGPHRTPRWTIASGVATSLRAGHPWVFRDAVVELRGPLDRAPKVEPGDVVEIVEDTARLQSPRRTSLPRGAKPTAQAAERAAMTVPASPLVGVAIADPTSPIAARIWVHGAGVVDDTLIAQRLDRAHALRSAWFPRGGLHETDAYRLVHGEGDRMPGVVMDRYRDIVIVRADGAAAEALLREHRETFTERLRAWGVTSAALRRGADDFEAWFGDAVPERIEVSEHGMRFSVDLRHGQKTGAFLDQRENRRRVRAMSSDRSVLNLFSYAGGFSLAAALGGASAVTSVDIASSAHVAAQRSMGLNGIDLRAHSFVTSDVFMFLEQARARARRWDLVICDPPSFAPNERSKPRALTAYRKLHRACAEVLAPGGVLCAASCSSHISMDDFLSTLTDETLGYDLRVTDVFGPPADHPTLAAFPEGRYLKFVVLQ